MVKNKNVKHLKLAVAISTALVSLSSFAAVEGIGTDLPDAPRFAAKKEPTSFSQNQLQQFKKLDSYSEPEWVTKLVKEGKLPALKDRLPKTPLVYMSESMPDGIGVYGGVMRHVVGGRPQGQNLIAGQNFGWGGTEFAMQECLTRVGPLFTVKSAEQTPMPNLAESWEWSKDGHQLTMKLAQGIKWSDGDPFDAEDVMFAWEDNIADKNVPSFSSASAFGADTSLEQIDAYTVRFTFAEEFPTNVLFAFGEPKFCPGPSHILKQHHPRYNSEATYESYQNALAPDAFPIVQLGAWIPTYIKDDEIMVMRRNPYYFKVDEKGQQLPYMDEMQVKLSTWPDRTVQTVAGNGDFSNMENPSSFVEALRSGAKEDSPAKLEFGPRTIGWEVQFNFSTSVGVKNERDAEVRKLTRNKQFRQAISHALDRKALGQVLVQGPFVDVYAGGIFPESSSVDRDSVVYYGYNPKHAEKMLSDLGFKDTDKDGFLNYTSGPIKGQNLEVAFVYSNERPTDISLTDAIVTMLTEVGIKVNQSPVQSYAQGNAVMGSGEFDLILRRTEVDKVTPIQSPATLAAVAQNQPQWHPANNENPQVLLPFEKELADIISKYQVADTPEKQGALLKQYNKIATANAYTVGTVAIPGAVIINKRFKNMPAGTPVLAYAWAEAAVMRERMWVPKADQLPQLFPNTVEPVKK